MDLPTYYIDLTPFIPILADGNSHNITMDVVSAEADHAINDNWFLSGNIQVSGFNLNLPTHLDSYSSIYVCMQVITDPSNKTTTGKITNYQVPQFATSSLQGNLANNGDLNVTVRAAHKLLIEADVISGSGSVNQVTWQQDLSYSNLQIYRENALIQVKV